MKAEVHPCRVAVTGKTSGPSLYHLLQVLGKERVLARIEKALGNILNEFGNQEQSSL